MVGDNKTAVLVLAPMPPFPTSAGNRRRLVATCEALQRGGFAVDFAYLQHEDQIYRRFGQQPPTDVAAMETAFRHVFSIPVDSTIPLKTWSGGFSIDAWCPDQVADFISWYFSHHPETSAVVINYVFLSRCLDMVPAGILRIIDTHDRFADRHLQYRPFRSEPNFFYTDRASEAAGLSRADVVLAIQAVEAAYFRGLVDRDVRLLPPLFSEQRPLRVPRQLEKLGFIGHGNDPNLFSISKFAHAWAAVWQRDLPVLVIAGEICGSLENLHLPGVRLAGYAADIESFYEGVDAVVAPMLLGSGLKMKVAEALAMGLPVIGTKIAFEGFDAHHPAHRLGGVSDTIATILRLHKDANGLAALGKASADLLFRYNAIAAACEAEWLTTIPRRPSHSKPRQGEAESSIPRGVSLGPIFLWEERSLRSLPTKDEESSTLVATENPSPAAARATEYTPVRRRWFAKVSSANGSPLGSPLSSLSVRGASVSFAPEWVRSRTLPQAAREALAAFFADVHADWDAQGRTVGVGANGITIVSCVPSFLLTGRRPTAAFVVAATGQIRETRLASITALARPPRLAFEAERMDLTPVPVTLTFAPINTSESSPLMTAPTELNALPCPQVLLLLSDDLIGRLTLAA
ncbi:glycosyltransferase [Methylobacterium sp. WL7]|uniref:glycosyltransferase n=1 Tax=Methylobacterium sp. WL7 TaxID=2603900 RepID=UPI0011C8BA88|nr:glycosyltransferase [Methylobacterium sp. WL7]TXN42527.1 glycosyltransferase [Methylobacterium sp. WL7]